MTSTLHDLFDLTGRVVLITGGSRGLGLQVAEALGEFGATIALAARKREDLDAAVAHLQKLGVTAHAFPADLSNAEASATLVKDVVGRLGKIDILVNNAGATWGATAEDHPLDAWNKVI